MKYSFSGITAFSNKTARWDRLAVILAALFSMASLAGQSQVRDTLKLTITREELKTLPDTVYLFSSRIDTIALQHVKADTARVARDINPLDLGESRYRIRFMGSVRVNAYYDLSGMTSTEGFMPYEIPIGEQDIKGLSSIYAGARQSRLGVEGNANTRVGKIKTYVEVDFASKNESLLRLRHAYAEWNFFKLGYTWSTFMDNASLPVTVEFEGPNSSLSKRHGIVRYERRYGKSSIAGVSIESPTTDYYNPSDSLTINKSKQSNFDIAGRYKQEFRIGHMQVAGIFRRIEYLNQTRMHTLYGWGLLISTRLELSEKHILFGQFSFGEGIASYYVGFSGRQLDAVYDPVNGKMMLKKIRGGFATYTYIPGPNWKFSVTGGKSYIKAKEFEPPDTFRTSMYIAANTFYSPIETIRLGFEFTSGSRTNIDLQKGQSTRISLIANFDF